jgi:hypothetical protein
MERAVSKAAAELAGIIGTCWLALMLFLFGLIAAVASCCCRCCCCLFLQWLALVLLLLIDCCCALLPLLLLLLLLLLLVCPGVRACPSASSQAAEATWS